MRIGSERAFSVAAPREAVWAALARVEDYRRWWPWLRSFDAAALAAGERWRCEVRPRIPYPVRFELHLVEVVEARSVAAAISGDISGQAHLDLVDDDLGCRLRLVSDVRAGSAVLRVLGALARPLARQGHDWVLDTGLEQFCRKAL